MTEILVSITVVILLVSGTVAVRRHRQRPATPRERARLAMRSLAREQHGRRRPRTRGSGDHFGKTKIRKYDDDRHQDPRGEHTAGGGDYGSDSGGGSSW